jgi:hypothetical protein
MWKEIKDDNFIDWHNKHKMHKRKRASAKDDDDTIILGVICLKCAEIYVYDIILPEEKFYKQ